MKFVLVEQRTQVLVLDDLFGVDHIECPMCGTQFETDTETTENMVFVLDTWYIECPTCGYRET